MSTDTSPATQDDALVDLTRPTVVQAIAVIDRAMS
jgi:hypothetical protein